MTYPATNSNEATKLIIEGGNQLHEIINEDALTTITTESGEIPSVRKAITDTFLFQEPIVWDQGSNETVFNQLRSFSGSIYWAPTATLTNPIPMGATPVGDSNWKLAPTGSNNSVIQGWDTQSQNEVVNGKIYPEVGTLSNGDTVPSGTTHLRVLVGGESTIVAMFPVASGVVSLLTEVGATIGATPVVFYSYYFVTTFTELVSKSFPVGSLVEVSGRNSIGDGGKATYLIESSQSEGSIDIGGGRYALGLQTSSLLVKPTRANSQQEYDDNKPSQMPTLQSKDLIGVNVISANADTGGRIVIFRKSGNGFVAENLVSGIPSGGDSVSLSCPAWRFGRVDYVSNIAPYKHSYLDTNIGDIAEVTTSGTIWSGGTSVVKNGFKLWRATGSGGYVDFETSDSEINILLGSSSDTTPALQCQIYYDGSWIETHTIKTDISTGYDVFTRTIPNPVGNRLVKVRFTASDLDSKYMMIGGVNASIDKFTSKDVDYISFYMIQDQDLIFNAGEGAQNYTIQEQSTGLFGGESHGGEFMSRRNVYFDNDLQTLVDDTFFVCGRVSVEQLSQVIWDAGNNINMDVAGSLTLTSEGSQFTGYFVPRNVVATTAYFAMFTHQGTFNRIRFPKYIDVSGEASPIQLQTGQGSGFKATDAKGRIVEAEWSEIYKGNPNYKPYLQVKPQNNPYNKYYYGYALPPEGGITVTDFGYVSVRKYSS